MAATFASRLMQAKGYLYRKIGVAISGSEADDASAPVLTAGSGAASAADPNGSLRLRTDGDPEFRKGGAWVAPILADGSVAFSGTLEVADGSAVQFAGAGTSGDVVRRIGATATEGLELVVFENTISPSAIETAVVTVPAGAVIRAVQANVETALTGGGTTVTFALGTAADPDKYGYPGSDTLAQNAKIDTIPDWAVLASAEPIVLTGAATGGTADGDTALTVGSVRVRVIYEQLNSLDDA